MSTRPLGLIVILIAACSGSPAPGGSPTATALASPTAQPASVPPATASPSPIAAASAPSPPATNPPGTGKFTICPAAGSEPTCPLAPGKYTAEVHDAFTFSIPDAGWQEERTGELETSVALSRIDDSAQRVTFVSGETGPTSPATIDAAAFAIQGFKAGQPTDVKIAGTAAQFIYLEPAGAPAASSVRIENQTIRIEPDRRYRFTVAKIPMMEEAATFIVVTEAPLDRFDAFLTTADQLLGTLGFF